MMQDKVGLEKLSEDEQGERFWIVYVRTKNGYVRETSSAMTEAEVQDFFEKGQQPASDAEATLQLARDAFRLLSTSRISARA